DASPAGRMCERMPPQPSPRGARGSATGSACPAAPWRARNTTPETSGTHEEELPKGVDDGEKQRPDQKASRGGRGGGAGDRGRSAVDRPQSRAATKITTSTRTATTNSIQRYWSALTTQTSVSTSRLPTRPQSQLRSPPASTQPTASSSRALNPAAVAASSPVPVIQKFSATAPPIVSQCASWRTTAPS